MLSRKFMSLLNQNDFFRKLIEISRRGIVSPCLRKQQNTLSVARSSLLPIPFKTIGHFKSRLKQTTQRAFYLISEILNACLPFYSPSCLFGQLLFSCLCTDLLIAKYYVTFISGKRISTLENMTHILSMVV